MANYGGQQPWDNGPASAMRASNADRERTVDVLKAAFAEGRLTQPEYEQRLTRTYQARTYGELGLLVVDLPQGPVPMHLPPAHQPGLSSPAPMVPASFLPVPPRPTNGLAVGSLLCGIAGTILVPAALPAIVLGHKARGQVREYQESGEGMATTGLVLGWLSVAFWGLIFLAKVLLG